MFLWKAQERIISRCSEKGVLLHTQTQSERDTQRERQARRRERDRKRDRDRERERRAGETEREGETERGEKERERERERERQGSERDIDTEHAETQASSSQRRVADLGQRVSDLFFWCQSKRHTMMAIATVGKSLLGSCGQSRSFWLVLDAPKHEDMVALG